MHETVVAILGEQESVRTHRRKKTLQSRSAMEDHFATLAWVLIAMLAGGWKRDDRVSRGCYGHQKRCTDRLYLARAWGHESRRLDKQARGDKYHQDWEKRVGEDGEVVVRGKV